MSLLFFLLCLWPHLIQTKYQGVGLYRAGCMIWFVALVFCYECSSLVRVIWMRKRGGERFGNYFACRLRFVSISCLCLGFGCSSAKLAKKSPLGQRKHAEIHWSQHPDYISNWRGGFAPCLTSWWRNGRPVAECWWIPSHTALLSQLILYWATFEIDPRLWVNLHALICFFVHEQCQSPLVEACIIEDLLKG